MFEKIQYCHRGVAGEKSTSQRFTKLQDVILENGKRFCIEFRIITKTEGEVNTCKTGAQSAWGEGGVCTALFENSFFIKMLF